MLFHLVDQLVISRAAAQMLRGRGAMATLVETYVAIISRSAGVKVCGPYSRTPPNRTTAWSWWD